MTTANGWTLIPIPSSWYFTQQDWTYSSPIAAEVNPFSQQSQLFSWLGADGWKVTVTLPPMTDEQAREWTSFLWRAKGGATAFMIGNPLRRRPRGSVNTPILVNGADGAMSGTLNLKGFHASQPRVLVAGDHVSVNNHLYEVCDLYVNADASGHATVTIGPSLREALTDGMTVATHDATGMFRITTPDSKLSIDQNRHYSMSLQCIEAR